MRSIALSVAAILAAATLAAADTQKKDVDIKAVLEASRNQKSMLKIYAGAEHGVPMFAKNPELEPTIVSWVKTELAAKKAAR